MYGVYKTRNQSKPIRNDPSRSQLNSRASKIIFSYSFFSGNFFVALVKIRLKLQRQIKKT